MLLGGVVITLLTAAAPLWAQRRPSTERHMQVGAGWVRTATLDQGWSARAFTSEFLAYSFNAGVSKLRERSWSEAWAQYARADLTSPLGLALVPSERLDVHYRYLRRVHLFQRRPVSLYVGGEITNILTRRINGLITNNSTAFESVTALSAAVGARWPFSLWRRQWALRALMTTPLVGWVARPRFGTVTQSGPFDTELDLFDYLEQGELLAIGRMSRIAFDWALDYELKNGNALRLGYVWDYYSIRPRSNAQSVESGMHSAYVALRFRF